LTARHKSVLFIVYEINGLSYSYMGRFPALREVGLVIKKGERIALLGANGSGKSTLLLALAGLVFPAQGSIKFESIGLKEDAFNDEKFRQKFRRRVGIVFQNSDVQLFNSSVEEELMFGLSQLGVPQAEAGRRMREYMELMDIARAQKDAQATYDRETRAFERVKEAVDRGAIKKFTLL